MRARRLRDIPGAIVLALLGTMFLVGSGGLAQPPMRESDGIEGFRELHWGISIDEAVQTYRDLDFARYVLANGKGEPWKAYVRRRERRKVEGVAFDSIEYRFRGGRFHQVRAVLHSRIGPRTLVTHAEHAFETITGRLMARYGKPSGYETGYVTEFIVVVKKATWVVDHTSITVRYEGTGSTNDDLLTLTMQEKPGR